MSGRRSAAVERAIKLVDNGMSLRKAAIQSGCAVSSLTRARRAEGKPRRQAGRKKGPA
jgi:hypothetical protein